MMNTKGLPHRILLISNDPATGNSICAALIEEGNQQFEVEWVHQLAEGNERLRKEKNIAAVLLELHLPDSQGLKTFEQLFVGAPYVPTLIIGSQANEALAKQAVELGAQDYILPDHFHSYSLTRALCHAIEYKVDEEAL